MLHFQSGNTFVADVALSSGKFYMEIAVLEIDSVVQFGFFTEGFFSREPVQGCFKGVGDDACSWAVDGTRQVKCFTGAKTEFGTKWINGDVVISHRQLSSFSFEIFAQHRCDLSFSGWSCFGCEHGRFLCVSRLGEW